jgi:radical SAM protein with 4Fe4S-binding SPASM domain
MALSESYRTFKKLLPHLIFGKQNRWPSAVDLELTNRCNLNCSMCWFHGQKGAGDHYRDFELTSDEVANFAKQLPPFKTKIYLGGGEVLLRKDFLAVLEHLKRYGFPVAFATNGTLMDSNIIEQLVKIEVDQINFSIDGSEAQHDSIRGRGVFCKATEAIRHLSKEKEKKNARKPRIGVNITVSRTFNRGLDETINAIRAATQNSVDIYRIHHLWFITETELSKHQQQVNKFLGAQAPGAACHLMSMKQVPDSKILAEEIQYLRGFPHVEQFPPLSPSEIVHFYSNGKKTARRCLAPWYGAVVKPNGDVKFCPDEWIDDYCLGNIRKMPFESIWRNPRARRFRAVLFLIKCFTGCKRCSWLYSF